MPFGKLFISIETGVVPSTIILCSFTFLRLNQLSEVPRFHYYRLLVHVKCLLRDWEIFEVHYSSYQIFKYCCNNLR